MLQNLSKHRLLKIFSLLFFLAIFGYLSVFLLDNLHLVQPETPLASFLGNTLLLLISPAFLIPSNWINSVSVIPEIIIFVVVIALSTFFYASVIELLIEFLEMKFKRLPKYLAFLLAFFLCFLLSYNIIQKYDDENNYGKVYTNKMELCQRFTQSYFATIPTTEDNYTNEKWDMVVDVETELYNLCVLDLNKDSLKSYKSTVLEKYRNSTKE